DLGEFAEEQLDGPLLRLDRVEGGQRPGADQQNRDRDRQKPLEAASATGSAPAGTVRSATLAAQHDAQLVAPLPDQLVEIGALLVAAASAAPAPRALAAVTAPAAAPAAPRAAAVITVEWHSRLAQFGMVGPRIAPPDAAVGLVFRG